MAFRLNLEKRTKTNRDYRRVLFTTPTMQLVVMHLAAGRQIGMEVHPHTTQFIRVESGKAGTVVNGKRRYLKAGDAIIISPGAKHNVWTREK